MYPIFKILMLLLGAAGSMIFAGAMVLSAMYGALNAVLSLPLAIVAVIFAVALITRASRGTL